jgi:hypothetical protein
MKEGRFTHLCPNHPTTVWHTKPSLKAENKVQYWTADNLCQALCYLVDNTFVCIGDRIYKQKVGIPMGTNCAVYLANYFLLTLELDFMIKLCKRDLAKAQLFSHTYRYIDDILTLCNPHFIPSLPHIYPTYLQVNEEQNNPSVHFLDIRISRTHRKTAPYLTNLFDKRQLPKFAALPMTRYPHTLSFVPRRFGTNIITSQSYRFLRRCMRKSSFIFHLATLIVELSCKGYSRNTLIRKARRFFRINLHLLYSAPSVCHLHRLLVNRLQLLSIKSKT